MLLRPPAVVDVAVVGDPDPVWGERIAALVVVRDGAEVTTSELDHHCLAEIARFKRSKECRFSSALPKNSYGKILKLQLQAELAAAAERPGEKPHSPRDEKGDDYSQGVAARPPG